jgi:ribosomal protein L2
MKRVLNWIFVHVLWPILKEVLKEVFIRVIKAAFVAIRELLEKWRKSEEAEAGTAQERDEIRKRYEQRAADVNAAEGNVLAKISEIVEDAMRSAESSRDRLLNSPSEAQLPPAKT